MSCQISVIVCTHNPSVLKLRQVINSLKEQTFPLGSWELLLIDNASQESLASKVVLGWHPTAKCIYEPKRGLTHARLCGFRNSQADLLVFVDDDNLLEPTFLANAFKIANQHPTIAAFGGKVIPEFEVVPPSWIHQFDTALAIRNFGDENIVCEQLPLLEGSPQYPAYAPIGAGLVMHRRAADVYVASLSNHPERLSFGRSGKRLVSGEDNDIVLTVLSAGWGIGYFPALRLTHLISANRLTKDYLAKLNCASSRSWVQVLDIHGIRPWQRISKWSVLPRKLKAFWRYRPWKSDEAYIRWKGACGLFEGLASLRT